MNDFDIWLFLWLNAQPDTARWALVTARAITEHLSTAALIVLVPMLFINRQTQRQAQGVLLAMLLAWLAARGLREWIPSYRPFTLGLGVQGLPHAASASFPSMHATMAGAWAAGLRATLNKSRGGARLACIEAPDTRR